MSASGVSSLWPGLTASSRCSVPLQLDSVRLQMLTQSCTGRAAATFLTQSGVPDVVREPRGAQNPAWGVAGLYNLIAWIVSFLFFVVKFFFLFCFVCSFVLSWPHPAPPARAKHLRRSWHNSTAPGRQRDWPSRAAHKQLLRMLMERETQTSGPRLSQGTGHTPVLYVHSVLAAKNMWLLILEAW